MIGFIGGKYYSSKYIILTTKNNHERHETHEK